MSTDDELDRLYQIPLGDFVAARNKLAAAVKKDEGADAAKIIKALPKPNASAWAVNQVYWKERWVFDALIAASDRLRAGIESGAADSVSRERDGTVAVAIGRARRFLEQNGGLASDVVLRRVTTTFDTLASYGSGNPNPMRGRLSEDLQPAGFGAFAGVAPHVRAPESPASPTTPPRQTSKVPDEPAKNDAAVERAAAERRAALEEVAALESAIDADREVLAEANQKVESLRNEVATAQRRLLAAETTVRVAAEKVETTQAALETARSKSRS